MNVHFQPITVLARIYDDGKDYAHRDPYVGVVTLSICGDVVYASGACGKVGHECITQLFDYVSQWGIKRLQYEHDGRTVVVER